MVDFWNGIIWWSCRTVASLNGGMVQFVELSNRRVVELSNRRMVYWWNGEAGGVVESSNCRIVEW